MPILQEVCETWCFVFKSLLHSTVCPKHFRLFRVLGQNVRFLLHTHISHTAQHSCFTLLHLVFNPCSAGLLIHSWIHFFKRKLYFSLNPSTDFLCIQTLKTVTCVCVSVCSPLCLFLLSLLCFFHCLFLQSVGELCPSRGCVREKKWSEGWII